MLPGMFYTFIVASYISHAPIGLGLESRLGSFIGIDPGSYAISYTVGAICVVLYLIFVSRRAIDGATEIRELVFA